MNRWGWSAIHARSGADPCPSWLRTAAMLAPWISLGILSMTIWAMSGTLTGREGVAFNLPEGSVGDVADTTMSVLMVPASQGTLVFFDDTRYVFDDERQMEEFTAQLARRASAAEKPALLVLADRRVKGGELMKLAEIAKGQGVGKILFAENSGGKKGR